MVGKWESLRPLYPYLQKHLFLDEVFFDRENVDLCLQGNLTLGKSSLKNEDFLE